MPKATTVCLTIGDATGIGPEITVKFLNELDWNETSSQLIVLGDISALEQMAQRLQLPLPQHPRIQYESLQNDENNRLPGQIAFHSLEAAVQKIHAGEADILVTGPISKENLQAANFPYSGHTEILQHLARKYYQKPYQSDMLFIFKKFRMLLLTRHVALRKVHEALSIEGVRHSLDSLATFLKIQNHIEKPRLCILGVNPHAGEIDGDEEERIIKPALHSISQKYDFPIEDPRPADAAFRHFDVKHLHYDAYVAPYHDQGLIPFKMVAGLDAVNVTIGLPFLRTSVSHGTAPDIAGQGIADSCSLHAAFKLALKLI